MIYINKSLVRILICLAFMSGLLFGFAMAHKRWRDSRRSRPSISRRDQTRTIQEPPNDELHRKESTGDHFSSDRSRLPGSSLASASRLRASAAASRYGELAATRAVEFPDGSSLRYYQPAFRDVYVINRGNQTSIVSESATIYIRWTPEVLLPTHEDRSQNDGCHPFEPGGRRLPGHRDLCVRDVLFFRRRDTGMEKVFARLLRPTIKQIACGRNPVEQFTRYDRSPWNNCRSMSLKDNDPYRLWV